ncbi:TRAP transporter fused permease subunit [Thermovorax subterraneus]|nr:TRAP transporter fused permease subunit [Thermovorax subterraneus]
MSVTSEGKVSNENINKADFRTKAVIAVSLIFLIFQVYIGAVKAIDPKITLPVHLCLALAITFLYNPISIKYGKKWLCIIDYIFYIGLAITLYYFFSNYERLAYRIMMVDPMLPIDLFVSYFLLVAIMEAVRRIMGMNLFIFILIFIAYAFIGQHIPEPFKYAGMTWEQFGEMLTLSPDGIFGSPLAASANTLFYFLIFGAFFAKCGGGQLLIDLGMKMSDKTVGGPAKAAVVSSALMGMVSGSAVANVSGTGVFTIPLMKKAGYTPEEAAAIESVSSTGGQIMPPIMGIGAFIMAEMIGISYVRIALAALIPAIGYYLSEFMLVHFLAKKKQLENRNKEEFKYFCPPILPRLYQLIPIVALVVLIFTGASLTRAALVGTLLSIIVSMFKPETRMDFNRFIDSLLDGVKQVAGVAVPTAACGIMIGIVVRSGFANKLTGLIAAIGMHNLLIALLIAMVGCLILGMALPTVAAYLISVVLFCPTLIKLGVDILPANMFIFYFGVIAQITPPVCLASYTAAGIAGSDTWKTGWKAFNYATVSFLIPYIFIYQPSILLIGDIKSIVITTIIMAIGIIYLAGAISGYFFIVMNNVWQRTILFIVAILIIIPETITTVIGLLLAVIIGTVFYVKAKKNKSEVLISS